MRVHVVALVALLPAQSPQVAVARASSSVSKYRENFARVFFLLLWV